MRAELRERFAGYRAGKSLKGTQTEKNLLKAFAGESQARNRYNMFAEKAREDGYNQIAAIFEETAHNEKHHAQIFFAFLEGGSAEITASYPAGSIGTTFDNLMAAALGEHEEFVVLYPSFAQIAEEEGFVKIANQFKMIARIEKEHEERYRKLAHNVEAGRVFEKDGEVTWVCRECGHVHVAKHAPKACPSCQHPQAVFEIKADNI
jgi:rubrerythrin